MVNLLDSVHSHRGISILIEGGATGADRMARYWAINKGIPVETYGADWERHGKAAGPIRNSRMIDDGLPDLVLAFVEGTNLADSRGTADMVGKAERAGIETHVVYNDPQAGKRIDVH